jgi:hypothetical protein
MSPAVKNPIAEVRTLVRVSKDGATALVLTIGVPHLRSRTLGFTIDTHRGAVNLL